MIGNVIRVPQEKLDEFISNPERLEALIYKADNSNQDWFLDLDKTWEAIHFLLCGASLAATRDKPNTLGRALFSFQEVDKDQDLGYGPAQYLTATQVVETNEELQKQNSEELRIKVNGVELDSKNIYPGGWSQEGTAEYIMDSFIEFKDFYQEVASNGEAIISFIN